MTIIPVLLNLMILALMVWGIKKLAKSRVSKKMALRFMALYCFLLVLSPVGAAIVMDGRHGTEPIDVPYFYYQTVLEAKGNPTLEELLQDEYLYLLEVSEIPMEVNDFSHERPLQILTRHREHDDGYQFYQYQVVVERTEEVDRVEITQLTHRVSS